MVGEKARPTLILAMNNNSMLLSDHSASSPSATSSDGDDYTDRSSNLSACPSDCLSPDTVLMSPWNQTSNLCSITPRKATIVGSILRQDGHVYSVAAKGGLLYTGSDRKNIRVWKNMQEFNGLKSSSAFVKAIVISGDKVFTGHQDGRIRIWTIKGGATHTQIGTLPTLLDVITASMRRKSYVKVRPNRFALWLKHADAISCLSMDEESGLLYSASWDRTFKVWKVDNSKCVESVNSHNDAVNAVAAGGGGMVYTGSADGALRVWKREPDGKKVKHSLSQTLLSLDCAITALAVGASGLVVYCGSSDGLVNFWEVGKQLSHGGFLKGHKLAVLCLAAAGNLVFSGSADKTICVWRREGVVHTCLTVMLGHTGPVKCLAVEEEKEADGGRRRWKLYSGSLDKSVKVWSLSKTPSE